MLKKRESGMYSVTTLRSQCADSFGTVVSGAARSQQMAMLLGKKNNLAGWKKAWNPRSHTMAATNLLGSSAPGCWCFCLVGVGCLRAHLKLLVRWVSRATTGFCFFLK